MNRARGASAPDERALPLWARRAPAWFDVVVGIVAAAAALASLLGTEPADVDARLAEPNLFAAAVTVVGALGLVWRRTHPWRGFLVLAVAGVVVSATGYYIGLLSVLLIVAVFSVAAHGRRVEGVASLAISVLALSGLALADVPDLRLSDLGQSFAVLLAAWAVGDAVRSRRDQQSERLRAAEWEAVAARDEAARAAAQERLRIARELHDVVAHSMSLIAVQAGVGAHVIKSDPAAAERALDVIADTSREALTQTRSLLGMLRSDDGAATGAPAPRIAELDALLATVREAGISVEFDVSGEPRHLGTAVDQTAYRIVQESLTNVVRHAGAGRVHVGLQYQPSAVCIEVVDDGRAAGDAQRSPHGLPSGGHGLAGLRERANLLGGTFSAGPAANGGYRVLAELPDPPMPGALAASR
jgi:signal transduction histidine kinase